MKKPSRVGSGAFILIFVLASFSLVSPPAPFGPPGDSAYAQPAPYYQGKTIRIIVGFTAGGFFDLWARLIARHMPKHIPGNPTMIVQNMPGAGSVIAANYVHNVAKPDGLTVVMPINTLYLDQLVGRAQVNFDVRKFHWIGAPDKWYNLLYMRADARYRSIADVISAKEPPKCGATGTASTAYITPKLLEETLRAKFNVVLGYPGGREIDLGVERGEVVCRAQDIQSHFGREPFDTWHKTGFERHLVQDPKTRDRRLPDTPTIWELMDEYKTPAVNRRLAEVILASSEIGRAMMAPPGTPSDQVKILREAYAKTLKDPELLAEAKKGRMDADPSPGEELQELAKRVTDQPPEVIERVKKLLEN